MKGSSATMRGSEIGQLLLPMSSSSSSSESEVDDEVEEPMVMEEEPPPMWSGGGGGIGLIGSNRKRLLSKQLSMRETTREAKWEKRRHQILQRRRMLMTVRQEGGGGEEEEEEEGTMEDGKEKSGGLRRRVRSLTDEDLDELRGSIELGFGFNEEDGGHDLCDTLPALDLYFAVNRQLSDPKMRSSPSPVSTPTTTASSSTLFGTPSPRSPSLNNQHSPVDSWKIFSPGDKPQHVKTRLRHWAQAVACSVRQCC